jgi:hypothetical protein
MGTLYLAFLLAPTILKEGSILRVGEAQYEANLRFAENQRMRNNLRGSKNNKNQIDHRGSRALLEEAGKEPSRQFVDENLKALNMKRLPKSIMSKSRVLEMIKEHEKEKEDALQAPEPAPTTGILSRLTATYIWLERELRSHQESEFSLSLIFILSGAICFAVGILLTLHTYLGEEKLNIRTN